MLRLSGRFVYLLLCWLLQPAHPPHTHSPCGQDAYSLADATTHPFITATLACHSLIFHPFTLSMSGHFRLLKSGTVDSLCATKTEHSLTNGNSGGFEDCKNKCALNFACQVFSYWKATKWCQTNRDCDHWTSDRGNDIASYERFKSVSTKARRAQNVSDET